MDKTAYQTSAIVTMILYFKYKLCGIYQGQKSGDAGLKAPEDAVIANKIPQNWGQKKEQDTVEMVDDNNAKKGIALRWQRIVGNDAENLPLDLLIIWIGAFVGVDAGVHMGTAYAYCFFRLLHTIMYSCGKQPFRTMSYASGFLCIAIMTVAIVIAAFK